MVRADAGSPSSNEPALDDSILSWVRSSVAGWVFDEDQDEDGGASPAHEGGSHGEGVSPLACADDERESDQYVAPIEWADMVPTTKWMEQVDSWETERDSHRAVGGLPLTRENASRLPPRRPVTDDTRDSVSLSSD
ncbi:hypothetical protein OF83DRAFT_387457 [Amylostereum chailletii]|nr:hypothetical protein OF83DRAFT_387457 [Amylostereum chailletii]